MDGDWRGEGLERLLVECAGGEAEAWRRLLENVRMVALIQAQQNYGFGLDDAEDLAQQVQIRVAERLTQLREPQAFPRWVQRLIHHAAVDTHRQRRLLLSTDLFSGWEVHARLLWHDGAPEAADAYDRALLRADLTQALSRLPAHYREPLRLHLLHGLPQDEVGRILGRPRSTVATQIERGLRRLRRLLAGLA